MDPEFKTFIDLVEPSCAKAEQHGATRASTVRNALRRLTDLCAFLADVLNAIGPYSCELRPIQNIKSVYAKCCTRREAIGHHGLI
jgi:hypothetical protein